jgi:hypothetical protein
MELERTFKVADCSQRNCAPGARISMNETPSPRTVLGLNKTNTLHSIFSGSFSIVGGSRPTVGESAAIMGGSRSIVGELSAIVGGSRPTVGESAAIVGGSRSIVGESAAIVGGSHPIVGESAAIVGRLAPSGVRRIGVMPDIGIAGTRRCQRQVVSTRRLRLFASVAFLTGSAAHPFGQQPLRSI